MTGNLITLADARLACRRFVDEGSCSNDAIDVRLAEAEQRLWPKAEMRLSTKRVKIRVQNQCFPLPWEVEKILHVDIDGAPSHIFNNAYEFLQSGPGDLDYITAGSGYRNLVQEGEFPTQFDIPIVLTTPDVVLGVNTQCCDGTTGAGYQLVAFATQVDDCLDGVQLTVRGLGQKGDEVMTTVGGAWSPGERFGINRWADGIEGQVAGQWADLHLSASYFTQITQVYKPVTKGPVCLYAVDTVTNKMYFLVKMVPAATTPSYVRYRVTNMACPVPPVTGDTLTDVAQHDCACILAIVKVRYMRATRADDVMAVQNLSALKLGCIGINAENRGDFNASRAAESEALRLLLEEKQNAESASGLPQILDVEASLQVRNHGYLI